MPKTKRPVRRRRRRGAKNVNKVSRTMASYKPNVGLPQRKRVRLTYSTHVNFSSSGVSHAGIQFRMNSIFDPKYASGGHAPYGRNQWATLYNKYSVISSKLTAKFHTLPGANLPVVCGAFMDQDLVLPLSLSTKVEQVKGKGLKYLTANSNSSATLYSSYSRNKWFNKNSDDMDLQTSLMNNNPDGILGASPGRAVLELWVQTQDGATAVTASTSATVIIDYWVELSEPIQFGSS